MSEFERIKNMSLEELANFINEISCTCENIDYNPHCMCCEKPWCSRETTRNFLNSKVGEE